MAQFIDAHSTTTSVAPTTDAPPRQRADNARAPPPTHVERSRVGRGVGAGVDLTRLVVAAVVRRTVVAVVGGDVGGGVGGGVCGRRDGNVIG